MHERGRAALQRRVKFTESAWASAPVTRHCTDSDLPSAIPPCSEKLLEIPACSRLRRWCGISRENEDLPWRVGAWSRPGIAHTSFDHSLRRIFDRGRDRRALASFLPWYLPSTPYKPESGRPDPRHPRPGLVSR